MSEQSNIFILDDSEYTKSINPITNYIEQTSFYYSKMRDVPIIEAKEIIREKIKSNLKDPTVKHFHRKDNKDKEVARMSLLSYINYVDKSNKILAPTFTVYLHPSEEESYISAFAQENIKIRSLSKKQAQEAKVKGDMITYINKQNEQKNRKILNNSISGAFGQDGSILYNPTGHSTLTSVTRSVSSLANSNNEIFLSGNRYYDSVQTVLNNCIYIVSTVETKSIKSVIDKYKLHYPTTQEVIKVLKYSSDLYWRDDKAYEELIVPFIDKLLPEEKAAICYCGDFYTIRLFNQEFVKSFITQMCERKISSVKVDGVDKLLFREDEDLMNYIHQIWFTPMKGKGKNYSEIKDENLLQDLYATAQNVKSVLQKHKDFIRCFFITKILPCNHSKIKYQIRRVVVLSDTDSTCFATDEWVKWYFDDFFISDKSIAVAATVAYICTQLIAHLLSILSANMNVHRKNLHTMSMKNEFMWLLHMPSEVSKHYCALTAMQEGVIYSKEELEVKGVHFINSAVPVFITKNFKEYITNLFKKIITEKRVHAGNILKTVINLEQLIEDEILKNSNVEFMKKTKIKDKSAYSQSEELSPYQRHTFWVSIFGGIYSDIPSPPYTVVKIPTTLVGKKQLLDWINSIENTEIKARLTNWQIRTQKKDLPTIYINEDYIKAYGIPKEIVPIIDVKRIILDLTTQFRLLLNSIGFMLTENRLVKDSYFVMDVN